MNLDNVFKEPQFVKGIGNVHPVDMKDYKVFDECSEFLLYCKEHFKIEGEDNYLLLDLIVASSQGTDIIQKMEKFFSLVLKETVFFASTQNMFGFIIDEDRMINSDNYDSLRKVIMEQNLIFTPKVYKDPLMQQWANKVLEARNKNGADITLEDMISTVSALGHKHYSDLKEYSIYQLKLDFYRICKDRAYETSVKARLAGDEKVVIEHFAEKIDMFKNPYDDLFVSKDKHKNLNKAFKE